MPVLMEVSRFLTTAAMASLFSALILPVATRLLISSSMASQRFAAFNSGKILSGPRMSPRFIARYATRPFRLNPPRNSRRNRREGFRTSFNCPCSPETPSLKSASLQPVQQLPRGFHPPAQRFNTPTLDVNNGTPTSSMRHVSQENHHRRKQIPMLRDVRLLGFQDMPRQRHMERIRRPQQQVKPHRVRRPVPD